MKAKTGIISKTRTNEMKGGLTDVTQGNKCGNCCGNMVPANLLVVQEEVCVLVGNNITEMSPTDVKERQEGKSSNMTIYGLVTLLAGEAGRYWGLLTVWRLMLLRKNTSINARAALTPFLEITKNSLYLPCPKI